MSELVELIMRWDSLMQTPPVMAEGTRPWHE